MWEVCTVRLSKMSLSLPLRSSNRRICILNNTVRN